MGTRFAAEIWQLSTASSLPISLISTAMLQYNLTTTVTDFLFLVKWLQGPVEVLKGCQDGSEVRKPCVLYLA